MKKLLVICITFSSCFSLYGQGEIDDQDIILFQNERSVSASLNSNGLSAAFRFGQRRTYLTKTLYDIELAYIKHPKEVKVVASPYSYTTSRKFVYGKTNIFIDIRPSIGFQREIFSKEDRGSIAIKYYYAAGPSLGITKPIYYTFNVIGIVNSQLYVIDTRVEKFEFSQHPQSVEIAGRASFWRGLDEISLYPGLHAKFGMSFEYSTISEIINAVDAGVIVEAFTKKIPIMYTSDNKQFYLTLFISYRFGWVVDARYRSRRRSDIPITEPQ
ncbi:MAG: hypothetical protein JXA61_02265 [Bacteroidales bacterium]|nr:hypothetical protein [Bacteroidales bacterium]